MARLSGLLTLLLMVGSGLAGCAAPSLQGAVKIHPERAAVANEPVVVALLDNGLNVYHSVYARPDLTLPRRIVDVTSGHPPTPIALATTGTLDERRDVDGDTWTSLDHERLYWFEGTNVLGISFYEWPTNSEVLWPTSGHGTYTSSIAVQEAPNVIVLMVEVSAAICGEYPEPESPCVIDSRMVDAMEWVAAQPWIDVVSLSFAMHAGAPTPETLQFANATRTAVEAGKIVVAGAGNQVLPGYAEGVNGPPWVIAAGGVTWAQRGGTVLAAKTPDVVSNWTALAASHEHEQGMYWADGTSMAAPRVAGVLANVIERVRSAFGHPPHEGIVNGSLAISTDGARRVTNNDFRAALNVSARYMNLTDWDPTAAPTDDDLTNVIAASHPVPRDGAYATMGWGYVDSATAQHVASRLVSGDLRVPAEKADAAPFMETRQRARETWWAAAV